MNEMQKTLKAIRKVARDLDIAFYQDVEKKGGRVYRWLRVKDFWNRHPQTMGKIASVAREVFGQEAVRVYTPTSKYGIPEYPGKAVSITLPPEAVRAYRT